MKAQLRLTAAFMATLALLLTIGGLSASAEARLDLPGDVKIIDQEAFYGDQSIESVRLPYGVEEIRARAFANSSVKAVNLPGSLTFIDDTAFDRLDGVKVKVHEDSYAYDWAMAHPEVVVDESIDYELGEFIGKPFDALKAEHPELEWKKDGSVSYHWVPYESCEGWSASSVLLLVRDGIVVLAEVGGWSSYTLYGFKSDIDDETFQAQIQSGGWERAYYDRDGGWEYRHYMNASGNILIAQDTSGGHYWNYGSGEFIAADPSLFKVGLTIEEDSDEEGVYAVTDYYGRDETVVIPAVIDGHRVERIDGFASWYSDESQTALKTVVIEPGYTTIEGFTFSSLPNLTSVTIPASVTTIDEDAFDAENPSLVIYGALGSDAERWANEYGVTFVAQ